MSKLSVTRRLRQATFVLVVTLCLLIVPQMGFRVSPQSKEVYHARRFSNEPCHQPPKKYSELTHAASILADQDPIHNFTIADKVFFRTFASAVSKEINAANAAKQSAHSSAVGGNTVSTAATYNELIAMINFLTFSNTPQQVNTQSKYMLIRLFPNWLLPAYKVLFGRFQSFSAWMNTWVTHWTTNWLMGPSKVRDLEIGDGLIARDNCLVIEKCRFLETSGCVQTCLHACKIPTQRFFYEEMALPVELNPNFTDFSCRFEFGKMPVPIEEDERVKVSCLDICSKRRSAARGGPNSSKPCAPFVDGNVSTLH